MTQGFLRATSEVSSVMDDAGRSVLAGLHAVLAAGGMQLRTFIRKEVKSTVLAAQGHANYLIEETAPRENATENTKHHPIQAPNSL